MAAWDIQGRDALSTTSGASGFTDASWMQGDFNVVFGKGGSITDTGAASAVPSWVWLAAVGLAAVLVWKKRR